MRNVVTRWLKRAGNASDEPGRNRCMDEAFAHARGYLDWFAILRAVQIEPRDRARCAEVAVRTRAVAAREHVIAGFVGVAHALTRRVARVQAQLLWCIRDGGRRRDTSHAASTSAGHTTHTSHAHHGRSKRSSIVCLPGPTSTAGKSGVTRRMGVATPSTYARQRGCQLSWTQNVVGAVASTSATMS